MEWVQSSPGTDKAPGSGGGIGEGSGGSGKLGREAGRQKGRRVLIEAD